MGWQNRHLHCFAAGAKRYGPKSPDHTDLWVDERRYRLQSLIKAPGESFRYTYDFGDNWKHCVILERTVERSRSVAHPRCIDGENACPPEDVGGAPGYSRLKLVLANPGVEEYPETREWLGQAFDATRFDIEYQNLSMWYFKGTRPPRLEW